VKREGIYNYCVDADPAYPSFNTRQNVVESITVWKTCEREGIKKDRSSDETVTPKRKGKIKTKRRLLMFSFFFLWPAFCVVGIPPCNRFRLGPKGGKTT
jgi:hypothetical protein